jgi:hypothetical protein
MNEFTCRHEINLSEIADEYAKRLEERVDEMALDRAADTLERFGYVKVVRCRDCKYLDTTRGTLVPRAGICMDTCTRLGTQIPQQNIDSGFCAWAIRKEGGK